MIENVTYDLHLLGWHSFQQLSSTIIREILGQTVQTFLDSNDGGRDGAFAGSWTATGGEMMAGQFVIQCKFTSRQGYSLTLSELSDELGKVKKLVADGRCDCYLLLTNSNLSGNSSAKIEDALRAAGVKYPKCYGYTWICQQIHENKNLRMSVPRLYGLGDLSQILDERAYSQARAVLMSLGEEQSKIVITNSYHKGAKAITDHGFVLLIGEPAAGKLPLPRC